MLLSKEEQKEEYSEIKIIQIKSVTVVKKVKQGDSKKSVKKTRAFFWRILLGTCLKSLQFVITKKEESSKCGSIEVVVSYFLAW